MFVPYFAFYEITEQTNSIEQASHIQSITFTVYAYDDVNGAGAKVRPTTKQSK